ncbi:dihydropteroate synthase [Motiliproteus sp. SC1-56]|uniref:dihydropteroate synthase n=1 Tax=Motiliproteus sp. SC1-56 TaxID=2799565 RepID=UPI001F5E0B49|nr:dihydropteroate synthase [Motiliproteus sp. SC1-56]
MRCGDRRLSRRVPHVMGILNVTPDSFSDGGQLFDGRRLDAPRLLERARAMVEAGASLLDIGGESTRPGAAPVSVQQELDRVIPAVELIAGELDVVVSVDTSTPEVMREAAVAGCGMLNDVRALEREGALEAAAASGLPVCLMHMKGEPGTMQQQPEYADAAAEVIAYLQGRIDQCRRAGIGQEQLLIDPGFGFGKRLEHNLQLLNRLEQFQKLGVALLVGTSRKSMITGVLGPRPVQERLYGSLATVAIALSKGAWIVRVHDVAATQDVVRMCRAVFSEGEEGSE